MATPHTGPAPKTIDLLNFIREAAATLFADHRVRAVGIAADRNSLRVVRNIRALVPQGAQQFEEKEFCGLPIKYVDAGRDILPHVCLPHTGPGSPGESSQVPEQAFTRPIRRGLQIQNFDFDSVSGSIGKGTMNVGTLGAFVVDEAKKVCILSNNHVLAGQNRARINDRILQPGGSKLDSKEVIARLTRFVPLLSSVPGARPEDGNAVLNSVDAAIAELDPTTEASDDSGYATLPRLALGQNGEGQGQGQVFKIGRSTSVSHGRITATPVIVGPVPYAIGSCWFEGAIEIEGMNHTVFSDRGDSGALIVKETGEPIGLLFCGNGEQSYACPISDVLKSLNCSLL